MTERAYGTNPVLSEDRLLHRQFERWAVETPGSPAVVFEDQVLTYAVLNARANRLARYLGSLGVTAETRVALIAERSVDSIVALLGVLKAGGVFVPVDPSNPDERLAFLCADATPQVILTRESLASRVSALGKQVVCLDRERAAIEQFPAEGPGVCVYPKNLAYQIYTSGSTGRPKGVAVEHVQVVAYATAIAQRLQLRSGDRFGLVSSITTDLGHTATFGSLLSGGCLVVTPATNMSAESLARYFGRQPVDFLKIAPAHLRALLYSPEARQILPRKGIVLGGELLSWELVDRLHALAPELAIYNHYGPTETTIGATAYRVDDFDPANRGESVPLGKRLSHARVYVLGVDMQLAPMGVPGEVYIGGEGVARGYSNSAALTAERFVPNPFSSEPGSRLYKTGDIARLRNDGNLEFLHRADRQLKIRGFRVEFGEIEAAILEHPAVRQAAVKNFPEAATGRPSLVGYFVADGDTEDVGRELRDRLASRLPDYMLPAALVGLPSLPLSPSGKVQLNALPEPEVCRKQPLPAAGESNPAADLEARLTAIWSDVLKVDEIGVHDSFIALGGDSLQAIEIAGKAAHAGIPLTLEDLLTHQSIGALAAAISRHTSGAPAADAPPPLREARTAEDGGKMSQRYFDALAACGWTAADLERIEDAYPLSPMQQSMLLHSLSVSTAGEYLEQKRMRLPKGLDLAAFQRAWMQVVARNPILRTSFVWEGLNEPLQVVHRRVGVPLEQHDLRGFPAAQREARVSELIRTQRSQARSNLSDPPLMGLKLLQMADDMYELLWSHHNALLDGWSTALVVDELKSLYEAEPAADGRTAPANSPYRDYIEWLQSQDSAAAEHYWREKLDGMNELVITTPSRAEAARALSFNDTYSRREIRLPADATASLRDIASRNQLTLHTLVMGAWAMLLNAYSRESDVVFGSVASGREIAAPTAASIAGTMIQTLPIRVSVTGGQNVRTWLQGLQAAHLEARRFGHYPAAKLHEWGALPPGQMLFNSILVFINHRIPASFGVLENVSSQQTGYPIHLVVDPGQDIRVLCTYRLTHFAHDAIERLLAHFLNILQSIAEQMEGHLSQVTLLRPHEQKELMGQLAGESITFPVDQPFVRLFEEQARRTPDSVAIRGGGTRLTYSELDEASNRICRFLCGRGARPDSLVAVLAERGPLFLTAVIGIFKAGASYLPLDPHHPQARLTAMVTSSGTDLILSADDLMPLATQATEEIPLDIQPEIVLIDRLLDQPVQSGGPRPPGRPEDAAYVIYTSGSTGRPKGAVVEQQGMVNHLFAKIHDLRLTDLDVIAQTAPVSFDISVWQFLAPLLTGGAVCVLDDESARDPSRLFERADQEQVTILEVVPSVLRVWLQEVERPGADIPALTSLRWLISTGEGLPIDVCRNWLKLFPRVPLLNAYGPTECSDDVTHHAILQAPEENSRYAPIGRAIPNVKLYVLDQMLRLAPVGVSGELCVGGICVGRGYLNDPERTAEAFTGNAFAAGPAERLYRTGDLVWVLPDGNIEFLGRADNQVKLHGIRIELGEIEAGLRQHPAVTDAAVLIQPGRNKEDKRLIAYAVPNKRLSLSPAELRYVLGKLLPDYVVPPIFSILDTMPNQPIAVTSQDLRYHLAKTLPDSMIPPHIVLVDEIPRTRSGKIDRQALPEVDDHGEASSAQIIAPRTPTEQALSEIWTELLGTSDIGIDQNFFRLGGNSLSATRLMLRVREKVGAELPIHAIFEEPTIAGLADRIDANRLSAVKSGVAVGV